MGASDVTLQSAPHNPYIATGDDQNRIVSLLGNQDALRTVPIHADYVPFDILFNKFLSATTTTSEMAYLTRDVDVASLDNIAVGRGILIAEPVANFQNFILAIITAVNGNTITLDRPSDYTFSSGSLVRVVNLNLEVDGSVTPMAYNVGPSSSENIEIHIHGIHIIMVTDTAPVFNGFGDLPALTNGIVLRRIGNNPATLWNVKSNSDFSLLSFDVRVNSAANQGWDVNGMAVHFSFDNHGSVIRLTPTDTLQLIIQDDITGLTSFRAMAYGHFIFGDQILR